MKVESTLKKNELKFICHYNGVYKFNDILYWSRNNLLTFKK